MKKIEKKIKWVNVIAILLTFTCYLSPYISPANFWPMAIVGLLYPILLLVHGLFILFWLLRFNRYFLFSLITILIGYTHFLGIIGLNSGAFNNQDVINNSIRITTFNSLSLVDKTIYRPYDTVQWENLLEQTNPDIICLQEFMYEKKFNSRKDIYQPILKKRGLVHSCSDDRLIIFSRFPIRKAMLIACTNESQGYLVADLETPDGMVRVINTHLISNNISKIAKRLSRSKIQKKRTWSNVKIMLNQYRQATILRANQVSELVNLIEQSPYPVILCIDMNDIPQSNNYQRLANKLNDSFKEAGKGLGFTYRIRIPGLRIDYVLTSPNLKVLECKVHRDIKYSDHYPVSTVIGF